MVIRRAVKEVAALLVASFLLKSFLVAGNY